MSACCRKGLVEKSVIFSRILFVLLCLFATNAHAVELLSPAEQQTLASLSEEHKVDDLLIAANNKLSLHNKKKHAHADLAKEIELKQAKYQDLITKLPETILAKGDLAATYVEIESLVTAIEAVKTKVTSEKSELKKDYELLLVEYRRIEAISSARNEKLLALKAKITKRIVSELSGIFSAKARIRNGLVECSKFKTMNDCLKDSKGTILAAEIKQDPFLNARSVLLKYKVLNATINLNGELRYRVSMTFKPSYNGEIDALLNERLGLTSAVIKLTSNVVAEWLIDGVKVGTGSQISHTVPIGRHSIVATYGTRAQSTVESIQSGGAFHYNFGGAHKSESAGKASKVCFGKTRCF
jgi:hypothetical protein